MARNGSGEYTAPSNSFNPAVDGTTIDQDDWNTFLADLEAALTASLASDGQTAASALIPFANGISTDTIAEQSGNTGVTIDGVLLKDGAIVVNETGADVDSRIEGDTDQNLVYVDAGNDRVGIGTATPATKLDVAGSMSVADDIQHGGDTDNKIAFGTDTQDFQTGGASRLDISDSGVRIGGAGARITGVLDEDDFTSDSDTAVPTQQSAKAYVDSVAGPAAASSAEMEAATATDKAVSPGRQHSHPGHPKAWVKFLVNGTIQSDYGVASVTRNGTGDWTITWDTAFSDANYCVQVATQASANNNNGHALVRAQTTTTVQVVHTNSSGSLSESLTTAIHVIAMGDQ